MRCSHGVYLLKTPNVFIQTPRIPSFDLNRSHEKYRHSVESEIMGIAALVPGTGA